MFIVTPDLVQALEQDYAGVHADVFKRVNAAYPYGVRLWYEGTGNTLEIRLCKSLDDAITQPEERCAPNAQATSPAPNTAAGPQDRQRALSQYVWIY
jgi:hypothetical protein